MSLNWSNKFNYFLKTEYNGIVFANEAVPCVLTLDANQEIFLNKKSKVVEIYIVCYHVSKTYRCLHMHRLF